MTSKRRQGHRHLEKRPKPDTSSLERPNSLESGWNLSLPEVVALENRRAFKICRWLDLAGVVALGLSPLLEIT